MAWHLHEEGRDFVWYLSARDRGRLAWADLLTTLPFADRLHVHLDDCPAEQRLEIATIMVAAPREAHLLCSVQVITQQLYGKMITMLRELSGGGVIMLPSSADDFTNPEIAALISKTQQSPIVNSEERVKFFKLAWDAIGSEFGSRHRQYEMFYAGAPFVTKGHSFRTYDWTAGAALVDKMLSSYGLPS